MITTSTGAKKLESSDNWREIFPNPGTSAAGAHNASVDAQDRIQADVAPIINGKRCSLGAASGEYVLLRNSTIAGKTDGAYQATKAIPANTDLDSTYLGSPITGGIVNELNNNLANKQKKFEWTDYDASAWQKAAYDALQALSAEECKTATLATNNGYHFIAMLQKSDPIRSALFSDVDGNIILLYSNTSGASYVVKTIGLLN